jgi:hypothetical protein
MVRKALCASLIGSRALANCTLALEATALTPLWSNVPRSVRAVSKAT